MAVDVLRSTASLLRTLADVPRPEDVPDHLVGAYADSLGARACAILAARPPVLIVFGLTGFDMEQAGEFESLPIDGDYPAACAYRESEIVIDPVAALGERYAAMASPSSRGRAMIARYHDDTLLAAPIVGGARTLGAFTLVCAGEREWGPLDIAVLSTIGHALGMWLTHPDSGLPDDSAVTVPELTERQQQVLRLMAAGRANARIAAELHCSESTVKAEVSRLLRALAVDSREGAVERAAALGLLDAERT